MAASYHGQPAQLWLRTLLFYLLKVKGFGWHHKRAFLIYRELELNLRRRHKKRLVRAKPEPLFLTHPTAAGQWISCTISSVMAAQFVCLCLM